MKLEITFLGTGTSQGVPVICCDCPVCSSTDPRDKRLRTSVFIQTPDLNLVVDTGPDFRYQALRAGICRLDAVLFTHQHRDHIAGLDDIRSYNYRQKKAMPIYGNDLVIKQIHQEFNYIFESNYPGIPSIKIHQIENTPFQIGNLDITPIRVLHHKLPVFGYRIKDFTYITDANSIPEDEMSKIMGTRVLVINALQRNNHISHFTLDEALRVIDRIGPQQAYLTHISHNLGLYRDLASELPAYVTLAYDGLTINLADA